MRLPGTDTAVGWVTGPVPPPPPGGGSVAGSPTVAYVEVTDRLSELSRSTARYSTSVPLASEETSWKTRYGALSSVPSGVHSPPPTGRQARVTWLKPPSGTATVIGERPPTTPPADGFSKCTAGASSRSARVPAARHTTADSGGTVTVRRPSASLRSDVRLAGQTCLKVPRRISVPKVTVLAVVALLSATTCSRSSSASMRLTAKTPAESEA